MPETETKRLSVEDLLVPRYKVIALWPQLVFKYEIGDILIKKGIHFSDGFKGIHEDEIVKYSHLFELLPWWAERSESDLPEYVRSIEPNTGIPINEIHKVVQWCVRKNRITVGYFKGSKYPYEVDCFLPATEQDFLNYQSIIK